MNYITHTNGSKIYTDNRIQIGKNERQFRVSRCEKNLTKPEKYQKWHWIFTFVYLDDRSKGFQLEIDYNNNYAGSKLIN